MSLCLVVGCGKIERLSGDGGGDTDSRTVDARTTDAGPDGGNGLQCSGPTVPFEDLAGCFQQKVCRVLVECNGMFADMESCLKVVPYLEIGGVAPFFARVRAAIEAGEITYDGAAAVACVRFDNCRAFEDETSCDLVFTGDDTGDDECFLSEECAPGGSCDNQTGDNPGACTSGTCTPSREVGEPCGTDIDGVFLGDCKPGDHCVDPERDNTYICTAGGTGDGCTSEFDCDPELYCNVPETALQGTCQADKPSGSVCKEDAECPDDELCVGEGTAAETGTCQRPDAPGDPCELKCYGALSCEGVTANTAGSCTPLPGDGEPCASEFPECAPGTFCSPNGTCQSFLTVGETCGAEAPCRPGLFCDRELSGQTSGLCREPQGLGAPCTGEHQCESLVCYDGACVEPALCYGAP